MARDAQKIDVRVASMRLESGRCRTESDWLALAEHCSTLSVADLSAPHVLAGEDISGGECDGFGISSSSAVVLDLPEGSFLFVLVWQTGIGTDPKIKELRLYKAHLRLISGRTLGAILGGLRWRAERA